MFGLRNRYVLLDAAGDAGSAPGGAPAEAAPATAPAAPAVADPAAPAPSALTAAANAAPAATPDFIPEKLRVMKDDGSLDIDASSRKLAEAYGQLERRVGSGDVPPKVATEYQVTVPDAMKEAVGDLNADPMFTQFRTDMHGLGLTQKQFDGVMARYFELAPKLAQGGAELTAEQTVTTLKEKWADEGEFKKQIGLSYRAADRIAQAAGLSYDDVEKAGLGNNPTFIRLMAAIGPEFSEDTSSTSGEGTQLTTEDTIKELMLSDANKNPKHPNHKATRARIDAYYERKYGNQPIA